jgi:Chitin synthase export chaperone
MGVQFGSFNNICQTAALIICPLIGSDQGIEPDCYSRNVDIAGTLIFQPCEFAFLLAVSHYAIFA